MEVDCLGFDTEQFGDDVGVHGLVALPARTGEGVERNFAVGSEADCDLLLADAAGRLDKERKSDAAQLAAPLRLAPPRRECVPIGSLQGGRE